MPTYSNGYIPDSLLITIKTGHNTTDGNWKHQLSAGTLQKHNRLVELARKRKGRTLEISEGWGAYRPYNIQEVARRIYGNGAAWPGTSSHGGFWEGKQTLAIDYGNWGWVYDWDRNAFYADVRAAGLAPGLIHPSRGNDYPDEPWHVVDLTPWAAPTTGSGSSVSPSVKSEEAVMAEAIVSAPNGVVVHLRTGGKTNFGSVNEYNTFRDQVAFLRKQGATDIMPLPPLNKVPKVTWDTFKYLCSYMGAPVD